MSHAPRPLRILYAALDQTVPGTLGGSVHVASVAAGLAALGHDVHVAVQQGGDWPQAPGVTWHPMAPPLGWKELRWLASRRMESLADTMRADLIMERYYNFGGEGVLAADRLGVPSVLEVNAPVIDAPGSPKQMIDRALLIEPMRRWRDRLCRLTRLFVTPSAAILPEWIDRRAVLEIEWGADVDRFRPDAAGPVPYRADAGRTMCVFAGAFRAWHGAEHLASALARLHADGESRFGAVFLGDGPERPAAERAAAGVPAVQFTGRVSHDHMPAALAHAHIGVAPFDPERHAPLQLGFFWSPLKIFEYMAAGLPVVAPALPRLSRLIAHDREGVLYDPADPRGLDRAIQSLADPVVRARLGTAARARVVADYSWSAHCRQLSARLQEIMSR
jgi:glycosyltransferase involved in cell wall biosynthesis